MAAATDRIVTLKAESITLQTLADFALTKTLTNVTPQLADLLLIRDDSDDGAIKTISLTDLKTLMNA